MDIKQKIIKKLEEIVKELTKEDIKIELSVPGDDAHGDYSSNIAMRLAKQLGKSPMEIAEEIVQKILKQVQDDSLGIEKIEAVKPGFINFYLSKDALIKNLGAVLESPTEIVGIKKNPKYPKAIVEYSSPNIAKPFTIGHLRSTIIGDAVANLLETTGYEVYRDNHLGDWGTQFGKQIYAIKTWGSEEELDKSENPIKDLVALYVKFHEEAEKNPELEERAREWFKKLEDGDKEARRLWQKCIDLSFKEFDRIYGELGVKFSENNGRGYGEAYFEDKMQKVLTELKEKCLLKEDNGAQLVYFEGDKLPPLMIIKKDGATLYATRDLATDKFRIEHYGKDILVINEVGAEQSLYFKQLHETEYMLGWYKKDQRVHIGHGMFRFKEGKMSTRKGNVIWLDDVIGEAISRAWKLQKTDMTRTNKEFHENDNNVVINRKKGAAGNIVKDPAGEFIAAEQVAIGALKWNDLKRSAHLDINFDWDEVLSMQGNSGPYVQYTYARTHSILEKANSVILSDSEGSYPKKDSSPSVFAEATADKSVQNDSLNYPADYTANEDELRILRHIQKFPEVVENAASTYSPNVITEYLFILSQIFNNFYQKYRILNATTEEEKEFRLALTATVGVILKQGLNLLGIAAPEKM